MNMSKEPTMRTPKLIVIFLAAFAITSYAATANELKTTIEAYGLSARIETSMVETSVTVTGSVTNKTAGLTLDIDNFVTVVWNASLAGNILVAGPGLAAPSPNCLLSISGSGSFEVGSGGKIETGSGYGLCNDGTASIKAGGEVLSAGGIAVFNSSEMGISGKVSLTAGLNGVAIYNSSTGNLRIQGSAEILVTGTGNLAIRNASGGNVSMSSGVVFGYGATDAKIIDGGYEQQSGGTNVIIAWNKPTGNNSTYTIGTSDDIFKKPATATAVWSNKAGKAGIDYAYTNNNNENTGFIEIMGVTVVNPSSSSGQNPSSSSVGGSSSSALGSSSSSEGSTPIRLTNNTIVLENLPAGTKIEVYNLQGKRIYSTNSGNSKILRIQVQTKGIYIIKQTSPANTHSQYFRLSPL